MHQSAKFNHNWLMLGRMVDDSTVSLFLRVHNDQVGADIE